MPRARTVWRCQQCGRTSAKWYGRCPECGEFDSHVEEFESPIADRAVPVAPSASVELARVEVSSADRVSTGVAELDRALGGGIVTGSLTLLGGAPGIGKSTLLLQAADSLALSGADVLYVCGEESPAQVRMRAERLGIRDSGVRLLAEVDIRAIEAAVAAENPGILMVDSIQTVYDPDLSGAPGSVGQVRACTQRLTHVAKVLGVTTVIVGHVTKDGAIAGPRVLEHMVDAVLYFEGDRDHAFRIVRSVKNRFGPANEIGVFEMGSGGLRGVEQPSAALLEDRSVSAPGSAVLPVMEGARPLLVEVQALVSPSFLPQPRRLATGLDGARLLQVLAILERRAGLRFGSHDVYVTCAGGVRVSEPAADVAVALALASSLKDVPVGSDIAAFGEIGLTGEVRPVAHAEARIREAARLGLDRVACPAHGAAETPAGVSLLRASTVGEVLQLLT